MTTKIQIKEGLQKAEIAAFAGERVNTLIESNNQTPIMLMLSGGSALEILHYINQDLLGSNITIVVMDERYSTDKNVNNWAQIEATDFYKNLHPNVKRINTFPQKVSTGGSETRVETMQELALRMEKALRDWKEQNPNGVVIATQGIGPDGHTSGIMPFPEDNDYFDKTFNGPNWVTAYDAGGKNPFPLRITTTLTCLREFVDHSIVHALGEAKRPFLESIMNKDKPINEMPAQVINEMRDVEIITDQKF